MKYAVLLILALCSTALFAQSGSAPAEVTVKQDTAKSFRKPAFLFKLGYVTGGVHFDHRNSPLVFQSRPGSGAELLLGIKAHKNVAIGLGGNFVSFSLSKKSLDQSVAAHFSGYGYYTADTSETGGRMNKTSGFLYASYCLQKPQFIFEVYTKLGLSFSSIQLHNVVYRHKNLSQFSEYYVLNKSHAFTGFLPMLGFCFNKKISPVTGIYLGAEYGYYFNSFGSVDVSHYTSLGTEDIYNLNAPKPSHIFQAGIGLVLTPFNR